jgi:hypothetical protein
LFFCIYSLFDEAKYLHRFFDYSTLIEYVENEKDRRYLIHALGYLESTFGFLKGKRRQEIKNRDFGRS